MVTRTNSIAASRVLARLAGGVAVILSCLAWYSDASAQFGGRGGRGGGRFGQPQLLRELGRESVQQELQLTDEQKARVQELVEAPPGDDGTRTLVQQLREAETDEERAALQAELQNLRDHRETEVRDQLKSVLTDAQMTRLEQIVLHRRGPAELARPELASRLDLSEEQQQSIEQLAEERQAGQRELFGASREERQAYEQEWNEKILAVLDDAQRQAWNELLGPPPPEGDEEEFGSRRRFRGFGERGDSEAAQAPSGQEPATDGGTAPANAASAPAADSSGPDATSEPGADVVLSFDPSSGADDGKMSFNFHAAPWSEVLRDFSRRAGLTLEMKEVPPGTFTYFDRREYTPREALDVLNGPLLRLGFVLVQRDQFLICANIDNGPPPNLIPYITSDELAQHGDNELLTVVFSVKGVRDISSLASQVQEMLGPQGKAVGVAAAGALVVTDLGTNLRRVNEMLNAMSALLGPEDVKFQAYPLKHISPYDAEQLLRSMLGLKVGVPNVSGRGQDRGRDRRDGDDRRRWRGPGGGGGDNGDGDNAPPVAPADSPFAPDLMAKTQFAADPRTNQLLVVAPALVHVIVDEALRTIDVEADARALAATRENEPYLQVYTLNSASPDEVAKTIDALMPGIVVNEDGRYDKIHIRATAAEHREVEAMIRQLDGQGGAQNVAVIRLSKMDPAVASATLQSLFSSDGNRAPTIQADISGRQILVRGTSDQIAQVRTLLAQLGEDGSGRRAAGEGGQIRRFSLSGRDSGRLLDLIERAWHSTQPNRIQIVPARPRSAIETFERPSEQDVDITPNDAPARRRDRDAGEPISRRDGAARTEFIALQTETDPVDDDDDDAKQAAEPQSPESASGPPAPPEQESQASPEEAAPGGEAAPDDTRAAEPDESGKPREIAPGIFIHVEGDELILMSEDEEALDRLEEMLEEALSAIPAETSWTVFTLQAADAVEAANMLEKLIPDATVSQVTTSGGGLFSSFSSMGSRLMDGTGLSAPAGGLRIIPEPRLNALFVSGPSAKVEEVRDFLEILDASDWPGTLRDRVPHMIPVRYAAVADVYRVVRDVYRDYLEGEPAAQAAANNPFAMFMGGGRNRGNERNPVPKEYKLTVGMDEQTSHLIVSADEGLYQEIRQLVESLDTAARDARKTVRVVELQNANTAAVQNTLGAVMPRVRVSTSGARGPAGRESSSSTSSAASGGPGGSNQQGPSPDQIRQFWERRMRERMQGGDGDGERRGFSGRGGFRRGGDGNSTWGRGRRGRD